jgi:hypothetical protein
MYMTTLAESIARWPDEKEKPANRVNTGRSKNES